ncbi:MAG: HAD hydrolase family protein [Armatimonadetes bacterium]|nr:HAD hydrolase family protein [Armatimonadota bacterium]
MPERLVARAASIRLLAMDVDGVLTDGRIIHVGDDEARCFHAHDGMGLRLAAGAGLRIAWITGRQSRSVQRRAADLGVDDLVENCALKAEALRRLCDAHGCQLVEAAYIGDDVNDMPALCIAGLSFAPADAAPWVRQHVDHITPAGGGYGAVRQVCEGIISAQCGMEAAVEAYLRVGAGN